MKPRRKPQIGRGGSRRRIAWWLACLAGLFGFVGAQRTPLAATGEARQHFATYYVDSALGSSTNTCTMAQNPATPLRTVSDVLRCRPGAGDTVRFRGIFTETIVPPQSGEVLYPVQPLLSVGGSRVQFDFRPEGLVPGVDYVAVYGSRMGNSGVFPVLSVTGQWVAVDTTPLPGGAFRTESAADPGTLQAAIVRPVHYTAWDRSDPPLWRTTQQTFHSINKHVVMLSYLRSDSLGDEAETFTWPAFEIDGSGGGNADFHFFDHLDIRRAEAGIATEAGFYHSDYSIIQYSALYDIGYPGDVSDEIIYWGTTLNDGQHHDYCQIMYNRIGPHNLYPVSVAPQGEFAGDGIEIKPSASRCTIYGNEITGIHAALGCDDAPLKIAGRETFVSNNYIHDIDPQPGSMKGCGISVIGSSGAGDSRGADGTILANNIVTNIKQTGIRVIDASHIAILNNVVFNVFPTEGCRYCEQETIGIAVENYSGATENIVIRNNIVCTVLTGIGRYPWSRDHPYSIISDHNTVYDTRYPFGDGVRQSDTDSLENPGFTNPYVGDFSLKPDAAARDSGADLSEYFLLDYHDAEMPSLPLVTPSIVRDEAWDRGVYEYGGD